MVEALKVLDCRTFCGSGRVHVIFMKEKEREVETDGAIIMVDPEQIASEGSGTVL